jgi:hypothetical protein
MTEYLYFVKWLDDNNIAEEVFEFFDEAKSFAMNILSQQPEIHQTEIIRNDFGECVDSNEIGKVWSWEELMDDIPENTETDGDFHIFTRGDFDKYADGYDPCNDPEFDDSDITFETDCVDPRLNNVQDNFRKPIPEGKTVKDLVEEMEENEDMVECKWCDELFDKSECRYEVNMGWLCPQCQAAIKSRGETLTFRESANKDYYGAPRELSSYVDDAIHHLFFDLGKDYDEEEFNDDVIGVIERWYEDELCIPYDDLKRYENWCDAVSCEVARQLTTNPKYKKLISEHSDSTSLTEAGKIEFSKYDNYEPGKYISLTTSGNYDQDVDVVLSCEEIMEALIELVDDEYIQYQTDEADELRTVDALRKANKLEEFFADDFGTHIHNYKDEILEYYEEACSEAIEDSDNELEAEWKNEGPGGGAFSSWTDFYRHVGAI